MTNDGPDAPPELSGEPSTWPGTVRDLLEAVREDSPPASELSARWRAEIADGAHGADRPLAFLEATGLVDASSDPVTVGPVGSAYLDGRDESVLYGGLCDALAGLETVGSALAIRPLTDVEIADLLATDREGEAVETATARAHRRWLEALGLVTSDDGVSELTSRGRRVVVVGGGSAPGPSPGLAPGGDRADAPVPDGEPARVGGSTSQESADPDRPLEASLPALYDHVCSICGDQRRGPNGEGFARVHYLMPTRAPHDGPRAPENAVVACPNHAADLEGGAATVDPRTREVRHAYEDDLTGRTLATAGDHEPGAEYLAYHAAVIVDRPL